MWCSETRADPERLTLMVRSDTPLQLVKWNTFQFTPLGLDEYFMWQKEKVKPATLRLVNKQGTWTLSAQTHKLCVYMHPSNQVTQKVRDSWQTGFKQRVSVKISIFFFFLSAHGSTGE